jgi:Tol biopolymer transport system component
VGRADIVHATLTLGDSVAIPTISNIRLAISPSGHRVVFIGPDRADATLWVRDLDQPMAHPLPDTKGAFGPFFSPDGASIGFFTAASGHTVLRLIPTTGGAGRTVVEDSVASYGGGAWGDDGNIYFTNSARGLSRVSAAGGVVTRISQVDSTHSSIREHDFPDVLPGSRHALVMLYRGSEGNHIGLIDLATGAVTDLAPGSYARYVAPGFLAIGTGDGRLLAVRFDPHEGKLLGSPVPVLQDVQGESSNATVQFAVSGTGTIIYQRGARGQTELVWVDRSGRQTPVDTALKGVFQSVALSPDGTRIAVDRAESGETQIWVKQLATGTFSRLSFDVTGADRPVWTPDGRRVAFPATRNNRRTAWIRRADASDSMQAAVPGNTRLDEILFDPLGRYTLLRTEGAALGSRRLLILRIGVDTIPRVLLASKSDNFAMALSPDGQWLAYVSNESGVSEVYVRPFPSVDSARFAISVGGGMEPLWRRDGKELFFRNARDGVFAVPVATGRHFEHGTPQLLFVGTGMAHQEFYRGYDVHPDGKRFLMLHAGGDVGTELEVIFNWRTELEQLTRSTP